jgi:hypothetical protein
MSPDPGAAIDVVSNSVVDATGPTSGALQGAHHRRRLQTQWRTLPDLSTACPQAACHRRRRQPRWWTLLDSPSAPPRGATIDIVFKTRWRMLSDPLIAPPGGSHQRRLKPQWWTLSDPPAAPLGAPPSMSSSKFSSRSCQTCRQHPQGPRHRCHLQNSVAEAARPVGSTPWGPAIDIILNLGGGRCRTHRQRP